MNRHGDFSRRYRAAASDFQEAGDRIAAARAVIEANRCRVEREVRIFWRAFWTVGALGGFGLIAFIAWMARH